MLAFSPRRRLPVAGCLAHPYLGGDQVPAPPRGVLKVAGRASTVGVAQG